MSIASRLSINRRKAAVQANRSFHVYPSTDVLLSEKDMLVFSIINKLLTDLENIPTSLRMERIRAITSLYQYMKDHADTVKCSAAVTAMALKKIDPLIVSMNGFIMDYAYYNIRSRLSGLIKDLRHFPQLTTKVPLYEEPLTELLEAYQTLYQPDVYDHCVNVLTECKAALSA